MFKKQILKEINYRNSYFSLCDKISNFSEYSKLEIHNANKEIFCINSTQNYNNNQWRDLITLTKNFWNKKLNINL